MQYHNSTNTINEQYNTTIRQYLTIIEQYTTKEKNNTAPYMINASSNTKVYCRIMFREVSAVVRAVVACSQPHQLSTPAAALNDNTTET